MIRDQLRPINLGLIDRTTKKKTFQKQAKSKIKLRSIKVIKTTISDRTIKWDQI